MKKTFCCALVAGMCSSLLTAGEPAAPYPQSKLLSGVTWHWETYQTAAPGSDLWPITWGPDGDHYAAWGDGGGFGGTDTDGRASLGIAKLEGMPPNIRGININGGKDSLYPASFPKKGKTDGLLYYKNTLYATVNLQDGKWPKVTHALEWSRDAGATWTKADWSFPVGAGQFEPAKFINFGKDYSGVPRNLAGYIYLVGPSTADTSTGRGTSLFLARVREGKLEQRDALEFFSGVAAWHKTSWVHDFKLARPIFTDPNGVSPGTISYDRGLKRYLLTCFHCGPGQLGVFDAPEPWGPWSTVAYYENWGDMSSAGEGLNCELPTKWMSKDGLSLWCVFAVYGEGAKVGIKAHDKFNLVNVTLNKR